MCRGSVGDHTPHLELLADEGGTPTGAGRRRLHHSPGSCGAEISARNGNEASHADPAAQATKGVGKVLPDGGQCATRRLWAGSGAGMVLVVIMAVPMPARFTTGGHA